MKNLHWVIVLLVVLALLGLPAWYALNGVGAQAIPVAAATGTGDDTNRGTPGSLRSARGRSIIGGGRRVGK